MRHAAPAAVFWLAVLLAPAPLKEQHAGLKFVSLVPGTINLDRVELPQTVPSFDLPANRLVFRQQEVRLVVEAGSDFLDDEVEVNGLLNPDIQVVRGARLTITVLNFSNIGLTWTPTRHPTTARRCQTTRHGRGCVAMG